MIRWRFVVLGVTAVLAACLCFAMAYRAYHGGVGGDFAVFWRTATIPLGDIYSTEHIFPFTYPPSALPWIMPLGAVAFWPAYWLFIALSVAVYYWAAQRAYSNAAAIMGILSPPMWWALAAGQLTPLLAGAVFLAFTRPSVQRGAILAIVISIKPQFAFLAPLVLWRDRQAFLALIGTGCALLALNIALWGTQTWIDWYQALGDFGSVVSQQGMARTFVSMPGQAYFYGLPIAPAFIVALMLSALVALKRPIQDGAVLVLGCSIFASPYAMPYDLVALTPWAAERLLRDRPNWQQVPKAVLYLGVLFPLAWLLSVVRGLKLAEGK